MKRRLPLGVARVLFAFVVLVGSIVTFNFGLNEGLNPADYQRPADCCDDFLQRSPDLTTRLILSVEVSALLLMLMGAFALWRMIMKRDIERRKEESIETYMFSLWSVPKRRGTISVPTEQVSPVRSKRTYNKTRL